MQEVNFNFSGKNFVVVGASSGIGRQIAIELAQADATVLSLARRTDLIDELKIHGKIIPAFVDVTAAKSADWDNILKNFVAEHGKIHGAVYTAGTFANTTLRYLNEEIAKKIMATSYWGMVNFIQAAAKKRFANDAASFVVFSSVAAHNGDSGQLIYSAAKSAVQGAVKVIAKEISKNRHRINSVSPGWVSGTGMTSDAENESGAPEIVRKRFWLGEGTAEKISGAVLFLLSEKADWITGTDIVIDGGQLLGEIQ